MSAQRRSRPRGPVSSVDEALHHLEQGKHFGKIVLAVQ